MMLPLTVATSTLFASIFVSVIDPLVVSAAMSPLEPVMVIFSLTELALMRPLAFSTITSPRSSSR